jgi:hypothetical protein
VPFFQLPQALPRDRFLQLLGFLRFYDCTQQPEADPLFKVRPFLNSAVAVCKDVYRPNEEVSVDESLIRYKGRLSFKQYIPTKRAKCGIKLYCACEATSGYLYNFLVHSTPAANRRFASDIDTGRLSLSEKIVIELCKDLLNEGYRLFCDKWFGSHRLAEFLLARRTNLTCTVRADRGVPAELRQLRVPLNDVAFMRRQQVLAIKIVERKNSGVKTLFMLDTKQPARKVETMRRESEDVEIPVQRSASTLTYNRCMVGVDRMDSAIQPYNPGRKTVRWFQKLGLHLIHLLVRNAWIVYNKSGGQLEFSKFLKVCIEELVLNTGSGRKRPAPATRGNGRAAAAGQHFPRRIPPRPGQPRPAKRCRMCYAAGTVKHSVYCCMQCNTQPGLCVDGCFQQWHTGH